MSIEISENTLGVWMVGGGGKNAPLDILTHLGRAEEPGMYRMTVRLRIYADSPTADPWEANDLKYWIQLEPTAENDEDAMDKCRQTVRAFADRLLPGVGRVDEVAMTDDGVQDFMRRFCAKPWAHVRVVIPEDESVL